MLEVKFEKRNSYTEFVNLTSIKILLGTNSLKTLKKKHDIEIHFKNICNILAVFGAGRKTITWPYKFVVEVTGVLVT